MSETRQDDPAPSSGVSAVSHVNVFRYMPGGQWPNGGATSYVASAADESAEHPHAEEK